MTLKEKKHKDRKDKQILIYFINNFNIYFIF